MTKRKMKTRQRQGPMELMMMKSMERKKKKRRKRRRVRRAVVSRIKAVIKEENQICKNLQFKPNLGLCKLSKKRTRLHSKTL